MNLKFWRKQAPATVAAPPKDVARKGMRISDLALATASGGEAERPTAFVLPKAMPGVIPEKPKMACDSAMTEPYQFAGIESALGEGLSFMGYSYLSELTQRPEYRRPAEILAKEMTRKWIRLQATGDEDKSDKLRALEAEMKRLGVQAAFQKAAEQDGYFGRSQIFLDMGDEEDSKELLVPLVDTTAKIKIGGLKRLTVVEPLWTYPNSYNSTNPLKHDFFKPQTWFVLGTQVDSSRLLTFVSRPVPDLLKPAYAFGGLSLSQMAKPYVDNWLRTRQSVSDLLHSFSITALSTDLGSILNGDDGHELFKRASLFNKLRDNRGLMLINKESEELQNIAVPLSGLDTLQAQSQEHMAAVTGIPLVVLLGITPTGLNASSEGELQTFYAWIEAQQEMLFTPLLSRLITIIQLSLWGEIDPEIGFMYEPLWSLTELELATARKTEAETDIELIGAGVITPQEARVRLAGQEDGPYAALDLADDLPEVPEPEAGPLARAEKVAGTQQKSAPV